MAQSDVHSLVEVLHRDGRYQSPTWPRNSLAGLPCMPSFLVHRQFVWQTLLEAWRIHRGQPHVERIQHGSTLMLRAVERAGCSVHIEGLHHLKSVDGTVVIVGNHMSTLETILLPAFIYPFKNLTYTLKTSLLSYPGFGNLLRPLDPITVDRKNPREDLTKVLTEGTDRLQRGFSMVIFPQSTRSTRFDPAHFNSLGSKLAKRAGVPVIPLALKTDAWSEGRLIKDMGPIIPRRPIRIEFGAPIEVTGNGKACHEACVDFIQERTDRWSTET